MFQTKVTEKIKTHVSCLVTFPRKSCRLGDDGGKILYSRTDENIACWVTKATETHS